MTDEAIPYLFTTTGSTTSSRELYAGFKTTLILLAESPVFGGLFSIVQSFLRVPQLINFETLVSPRKVQIFVSYKSSSRTAVGSAAVRLYYRGAGSPCLRLYTILVYWPVQIRDPELVLNVGRGGRFGWLRLMGVYSFEFRGGTRPTPLYYTVL